MDLDEQDIPDIPILYPRGGISHHHCQDVYTKILSGVVQPSECHVQVSAHGSMTWGLEIEEHWFCGNLSGPNAFWMGVSQISTYLRKVVVAAT